MQSRTVGRAALTSSHQSIVCPKRINSRLPSGLPHDHSTPTPTSPSSHFSINAFQAARPLRAHPDRPSCLPGHQLLSRQHLRASRPSSCLSTSLHVRYCSHIRKMHRQRENDSANATLDVSKGREVLPKNVKPLHYDLTLEPDFKTFTYDGTVAIE